jgi:MFS family permease
MSPTYVPLIVTIAIQSLASLSMVAVPVLAPSAAPDIGVPATYVGIFVGLIYLGAMWTTLLAGGFVRRYGAIRISQIALLVCAAGLLLLVGASPWFLVPSAILIGFGYGPITPASSHVLMKTTPRDMMALIFSIKQTGVPLGGMLAGLVLPPLIVAFGWRGGVLAVALACIAVAGSAESTRRQLDTDLHSDYALSLQSIGAPLKLVWSVPTLRLLGISSFFLSSVQVCLTAFLLPYLTTRMKFPLITAGVIFSVAQGGGVVGRILWGYLADRVLSPALMLSILAVTMTVTSLVTAVISPAAGLPALICLFVLYGAAAIGWNGVYLAEVARQAPSGHTSTATGGSLVMTFLGAMVGPPFFGLIAEWSGTYTLSFILTGLPAAVCGIALFRMRGAFVKFA